MSLSQDRANQHNKNLSVQNTRRNYVDKIGNLYQTN